MVNKLLFIWSTITTIGMGAALWVVKNPEKAQVYWAVILSIGRAFKYFERNAVKNDLEGRIAEVSNGINSELGEILPYGMKVKWQLGENTTKQSFIESGNVVVKMSKYRDRDHNLAIATAMYVSKGLLPRARVYVEPSLMKSADLVITDRLLRKWNEQSLRHFFDEVLNPLIKENPIIDEYIQNIAKIDEIGMFTHILLQEFRELGTRLYPSVMPNNLIKEETVAVIKFLKDIANKGYGEEVPLLFKGRVFKFGIVIVASFETLRLYGIDAHINRVNQCINQGADRIYLSAFGERESHAKQVAQRFETDPRVISVEKRPYKISPYTNITRSEEGVYFVIKAKKEKDMAS